MYLSECSIKHNTELTAVFSWRVSGIKGPEVKHGTSVLYVFNPRWWIKPPVLFLTIKIKDMIKGSLYKSNVSYNPTPIPKHLLYDMLYYEERIRECAELDQDSQYDLEQLEIVYKRINKSLSTNECYQHFIDKSLDS